MRHASFVAAVLALSLLVPPVHAAWPAENGTLAFLSDRKFEGQNPAAAGWHIFAAGPDGSTATPLTRQSTIGYGVGHQDFAWSPDGRWIAFASDRESNNYPAISVMRADGSGARRITRLFETAVNPSWSPDGRHIVFQAWRRSGPPTLTSNGFTYNLYVVEADGSDEREIPRDRFVFSQPAWSPDGREIAVEVATRWSVDIELIPADGARAGRPLVRTGDAWESSPTWSPDGRWIAF